MKNYASRANGNNCKVSAEDLEKYFAEHEKNERPASEINKDFTGRFGVAPCTLPALLKKSGRSRSTYKRGNCRDAAKEQNLIIHWNRSIARNLRTTLDRMPV